MLYGDIFWEIITLFLLTREMYQIKTCHNFFFLNIHFRENLYMREQGTLFFLVGRKLFPSFNDNKEDILVGRMLRCQTSWPHLLSCPHFGTNKGMANVWPSCRIPAHKKSYWELVGFWMGTIPYAIVMHVKREHGQLCDLTAIAQRKPYWDTSFSMLCFPYTIIGCRESGRMRKIENGSRVCLVVVIGRNS